MTIDWWTLGIQTVNVLVLVWLLKRFFWRPVAAMIEKRRTSITQTLAEADKKQRDVQVAWAEIEKTRGGFAAERDAILAKAREAAEQARSVLLADAAKQAADMEAAGRVAIEKARKAAEKDWADQASKLAIEIAKRLASRLDGPSVRAAFLGWLVDSIRGLPETTRKTVAANGAELQAVSAQPLDPGDQELYRRLIGEAFGGHPKIAFKEDSALIGGLELHGSHCEVTNSWRADLDRILLDLTHAA